MHLLLSSLSFFSIFLFFFLYFFFINFFFIFWITIPYRSRRTSLKPFSFISSLICLFVWDTVKISESLHLGCSNILFWRDMQNKYGGRISWVNRKIPFSERWRFHCTTGRNNRQPKSPHERQSRWKTWKLTTRAFSWLMLIWAIESTDHKYLNDHKSSSFIA